MYAFMIGVLASKKGFGLIEAVVATAIASAALVAFLQAGALSLRLLRNEKENLRAKLLAQDAWEAARAVRDASWDDIAWRTAVQNPSLPYYPVLQNGKWALSTTTPGPVGVYNQYVVFSRVRRDGSDRIVAVGGADDPGTRMVVSGASSTARRIEIAGFLTNFQSYLPRPIEIVAVSYEGAVTDANLGNFPSNNSGDGDPAQGFTVGAAPISVSKVELPLRRATPAPSSVFVEVRSGPTGPVLGASGAIASDTISSSAPSWVEFLFSEPVPLNAGTKYYIRMRSIPTSTDVGSGSAGTIYWDYLQTGSSPYSGGEARRYIGRLSNPNDAGQPLDEYDFGFRVYAVQ